MPSQEQSTSRPHLVLVYALFFVSGATALVYETAWARTLTLTFGATHEAVAVVLGAFMGGLALGGFVFGIAAQRFRRPLLAYGVIEVLIGLSALVAPMLLRLVDRVYVEAALRVDGIPWQLQAMQVALAFGVLVVPTALMGGTLPVLARLLITRYGDFSMRLSALYGINTSGAVVGTLAAGFFLLPRLGISRTQLVAVSLNLAIGVLAIALGRRPGLGTDAAEAGAGLVAQPAAEGPGPAPAEAWRRLALRLAFAGTVVSGMCALALEVLWMRGISIAVGNTAYSFSVMLAAFLVGIALGSWLQAALPLERFEASLKFGVVMLGIGLTSAVFSQLTPQLPRFAVAFNRLLYAEPGGVRAGATLLISFSIMLVPSILMGAAFPLAGLAGARLRGDFGRSVGDLVGLNTLGAIVGSLGAGFVLIPFLGLQRGMLVTAACIVAYGCLVLGTYAAGRYRGNSAIPLLTALAVALGGLTLAFRLPDWDMHLLAVFRNNMVSNYARAEAGDLDQMAERSTVLYYREGKAANVSVVEGARARALVIDGKTVATDGLSDMQHELVLGHVPVLVHPRPRSVAVVGLGAGVTLGAVLAHPDLERIVVIEIEPAVVDGARKFAHVNDRALDDPRLEIAFQDGRNYLRTTAERFDVITADPIHPWARGAAYLYTREYYQLARDHLTGRGVMCQWLPLYELSLENVRSAAATFAAVFEHSSLWQTANDAILVGSQSPISIEPDSLARRLGAPRVASQLSQVGLGEPISLLAELTLDTRAMERFAAGAILNTDDNLYLEFSSPLGVARSELGPIFAALDDQRSTFASVVTDLDFLTAAGRDPADLLAEYRQAKAETIRLHSDLTLAEAAGDPTGFEPIIAKTEALLRRLPGYGRATSILSAAHMSRGIQHFFAGDAERSVAALREAVAVMPNHAAANHHLATILSEQGGLEEALAYFQAATRLRPLYSKAHHNHGVTLLRLGRFQEARGELALAVAARPDDAGAHHMYANALAQSGVAEEALANYRRALALQPRLQGLHHNFGAFLVQRQRYREAAMVLDLGIGTYPQDLSLLRQAAWLLATAPEADIRDPDGALRLARIVDDATRGEIPTCLDTLAAALAATGSFDEAVATAEKGLLQARAQGDDVLAPRIEERLGLYRRATAFQLPPGRPESE